MAMDLNAKAAYIRGLMTGMDFDADSKNGKVIAAMMDLLEEMAAQVVEHDNALDQVYDELETLDQDVADIVSDLYADDDEDDEDLEELSALDGDALREVLIQSDIGNMAGSTGDVEVIGDGLKYATMVVSTLPIMCLYPFLQKYFVACVTIRYVMG